MVEFNTSNLVNHPNPMMRGVKQFKLEFANGDFISAIGGTCNVMNIQGDGINEFELYTSENSKTELIPWVDIDTINEKIYKFILKFGNPVLLNGSKI